MRLDKVELLSSLIVGLLNWLCRLGDGELPIYDYQCGSCGHRFELRQSFSAESEASCLKCGSSSRRRFHAPTIIYKGSGFYTTDYKRKSVSEPTGRSGQDPEEKTSTSDKSTSETSDDTKSSEVKTGASEAE